MGRVDHCMIVQRAIKMELQIIEQLKRSLGSATTPEERERIMKEIDEHYEQIRFLNDEWVFYGCPR